MRPGTSGRLPRMDLSALPDEVKKLVRAQLEAGQSSSRSRNGTGGSSPSACSRDRSPAAARHTEAPPRTQSRGGDPGCTAGGQDDACADLCQGPGTAVPCGRARRRSRAGSPITRFCQPRSTRLARTRSSACGSGTAFHDRSRRGPCATALPGVGTSSGPSSSGIYRSSASRFPPPPCGASGPCWLTTTARSGTRRSSPAPSA